MMQGEMRRRFAILLFLIFALLLAGIFLRQGGLISLAVPLAVYLGAAIFYRPEKMQVHFERALSARRVVEGKPVEVKLTLINNGARLEEVFVKDMVPAGLELIDGNSEKLVTLPAKGTVDLEYTVQGKRGEYRFGEVGLSVRDVFGLFEGQVTVSAESELIIEPYYARLKNVTIRPRQTHGFAGPILSRQGGSGVDFFGVREYQPGDPSRQINWKMAARVGNDLFTNIFEQDMVTSVGIVLDARLRSDVEKNGDTIFEYSVRAAAALADRFLKDGNRVGLLIYGWRLELIFPGYGKVQRQRILHALTAAKPGFNFALESLQFFPVRFFPPHSQIVILSPILPDDLPIFLQLHAQGYRLMVISPDPVSFESQGSRGNAKAELAERIAFSERAFLIQKVRRAGIQVVDWHYNQPLDPLLRTSLRHQPVERRF